MKVIESKNTPRTTKILKVSYGYYVASRKKYPLINLAGLYLKTFNFQIGDRVKVEIAEGTLTITKIKSTTEEQKKLPLV